MHFPASVLLLCRRLTPPAVLSLQQQSRRICGNLFGSRPKEMFLDVIEELETLLEEDTALVARVMQASEVSIDSESTFEAFRAILYTGLDDAIDRAADPEAKAAVKALRKQFEDIPDHNVRLCFEEIVGKACEAGLLEGRLAAPSTSCACLLSLCHRCFAFPSLPPTRDC